MAAPVLAKFMAALHYTYNKLKMPGAMSIITVGSDKKDVLIWADQLYREAVVAYAAKHLLLPPRRRPARPRPPARLLAPARVPALTLANAPVRSVVFPLRTS